MIGKRRKKDMSSVEAQQSALREFADSSGGADVNGHYFARMAAELSRDAICVVDLDRNIVWVNQTFLQLQEYAREEVIGKSVAEITMGGNPELLKTNREALEKIGEAESRGESVSVEMKTVTRRGGFIWSSLHLAPLKNRVGDVTNFIVASRDISERKALEDERTRTRQVEKKRNKERHLLSKTGEWLYSARTLNDLYSIVEKCVPKILPKVEGGLYIYSNSRDVLDLAVSFGELPSPSYIEPDQCWALRRGRSYQFGKNEIEFPCEHMEVKPGLSFCLPLVAHGETIGMLWFSWDKLPKAPEGDDVETVGERYWELALMLSEQISLTIANVRLRQELQDRSIKDPLTELWNRRYFSDTLRKAKARCDDRTEIMALVSLDIDHFKLFNDHHGHDAGDLVLRHVGDTLKEQAADVFAPFRVGGEEFALICPCYDEQATMGLVEELRERIKNIEIKYHGQKLPQISFSAGIAVYPSDSPNTEELIKLADEALYSAKKNGRDQSVLASSVWTVPSKGDV
jgi:diguanylate cyclase (GGDEF)-like protein/PAS domain S-box-containing protein